MAPPRKPTPFDRHPHNKKSDHLHKYGESAPTKDPDSLDPKLLVINKRGRTVGQIKHPGPLSDEPGKKHDR